MKPQGLSSEERIKSKKEFQDIFSRGNVIVSADSRLKVIYTIEHCDMPGIKIAAAVSKKTGNAVWRNRVKRLIKAAYRLNKSILSEFCILNNVSLKIVFAVYSVNKKRFPAPRYFDLLPSVLDLMNKIKEKNK